MMNTEPLTLKRTLAENINYLQSKAGVNSTELARRTGLPAATIKTLRHGDNINPTLTTLLAIAKFFSVTVSQLIGEEKLYLSSQNNLTERSFKEIPILSLDEVMSWQELGVKVRQFIAIDDTELNVDFGLRVEQEGIRGFPYGTVLLAKSGMNPRNQDIVIVKKSTQNKIVLKKLLDEGDGCYLESLISGYPTVACTEDHRVLGVVIEMKRILNKFSKE